MNLRQLTVLGSFTFAVINAAHGQSIQHTQVDATPLTLNPAFTGMIDGKLRSGMVYRNQWRSVFAPYVGLQLSADAPVLTLKNGDYIGAGGMVIFARAGDGNLKDFTGVASAAYHKVFGSDSSRAHGKGSELAVGIQGGYSQRFIDMSGLYFGNAFVPGNTIPGLYSTVNYTGINMGASFSQSVTRWFNYTIGLTVNNINQPTDALLKKQSDIVGLDTRYTGLAGCNILLGQRLTLKPSLIYITSDQGSVVITGNEFLYRVSGASSKPVSVFAGGWYRNGDYIMVTTGVSIKNVRVGAGYDYNISTLNSASNGNGGFEIALTYINRGSKATSRQVPCNRF